MHGFAGVQALVYKRTCACVAAEAVQHAYQSQSRVGLSCCYWVNHRPGTALCGTALCQPGPCAQTACKSDASQSLSWELRALPPPWRHTLCGNSPQTYALASSNSLPLMLNCCGRLGGLQKLYTCLPSGDRIDSQKSFGPVQSLPPMANEQIRFS